MKNQIQRPLASGAISKLASPETNGVKRGIANGCSDIVESSNGTAANAPNGRAPQKRGSSNKPNSVNGTYSSDEQGQAQSRNNRRHLLLDERPLVLLPSLAKAVGVDGALVLQQLHYYLVAPKCGRVIDGKRWIYNTYEQWQAHDFPLWSTRTLRRTFTALETRGLVVSRQPETRADGSSNRRKYYRIDYEQLNKVVAAFPSQAANLAAFDAPLLAASRTETSTETTKRPKGNAPRAASFGSLRFPKSVEEITEALQAEGIKIPSAFVQRFFTDMQASKWTIRRVPVRKWLATLEGRWEKNEAHWSTDESWRAGKMPLRRMRIEGLERLRERIVDESNDLFRSDPVGSKERRRELARHIKDVETTWERKTKRSAEELKLKYAASRSVGEHEAVRNKPIFPW
jgi:hypothetical protein